MKYASFASSPPVKSSLVGIVDVFFDRYRWLIVEDCERHDTDPRHIHHLFRGILGMWLRLRPFRAPWAWLGILSMRYSFLVVAWQMISLESACCAFCRPTLSLHRSMCCRFRNAHTICCAWECHSCQYLACTSGYADYRLQSRLQQQLEFLLTLMA